MTLDAVLCDREARADSIRVKELISKEAVLEGRTGLLGCHPRVKMTLEFWPLGLARSEYGAERLLARLVELGFRIYDLDERSMALRRADPRRLLERFPAGSEQFTNLMCVKTSTGRQ